MKQQSSDIRQQTDQICDPWEKGDRQGKPYNYPDILPGGILQTVEKKQGSQAEDLSWGDRTGSSENLRAEFRRGWRFVGRELQKSALVVVVGGVPLGSWLQTEMCRWRINLLEASKDQSLSSELNSSESSQRLGIHSIPARVITGDSNHLGHLVGTLERPHEQ